MVACAFVAQRAVDDDEVRRWPEATICPDDVKLISKRHPLAKSSSATRTAKETPTAVSDLPSGEGENIQFGVITWPACERLGTPSSAQMADKVAVWIQKTGGGNGGLLDFFLASRFPHQRRGYEDRRR